MLFSCCPADSIRCGVLEDFLAVKLRKEKKSGSLVREKTRKLQEKASTWQIFGSFNKSLAKLKSGKRKIPGDRATRMCFCSATYGFQGILELKEAMTRDPRTWPRPSLTHGGWLYVHIGAVCCYHGNGQGPSIGCTFLSVIIVSRFIVCIYFMVPQSCFESRG
uniref:Uncharacterized protein n=1 Tax=Cucumis melo TaxID=3656 RepID=A0A9I9EMG3_CUCME